MHAVSCGTVLYCTVLYCTVLYCASLLTYNDFAHHTALGESLTGHGGSRHFHLHLAVICSKEEVDGGRERKVEGMERDRK
jgi:hypothetical protein